MFEVGDKVKITEIDAQGFSDMLMEENLDLQEKYPDVFDTIWRPEIYEGQIGVITKVQENDSEENDTDWYWLTVETKYGPVKMISLCWPDGSDILWTAKLEKVG